MLPLLPVPAGCRSGPKGKPPLWGRFQGPQAPGFGCAEPPFGPGLRPAPTIPEPQEEQAPCYRCTPPCSPSPITSSPKSPPRPRRSESAILTAVSFPLGIGDVTQPIAPVAAAALHTAAAELATQKGQKGYGPAAGYPFLREAIAAQYADLPCPIPPEEVTVTAGSKEALGALFSLWEPGVPVWVCDPVYPAYRAQAEAAGHPVFSLPCRAENDFLPQPEEAAKPGLIVLCTPNNPTGAALSLVEMTEWVNWANRTGSLLLVDTAYAAFLSGEELPRSIYAVPGAKRCAIEVGSFSKSDGFTGVRCGWVILPRETGCAAAWQRWLGSHSNGTSYPIQRAAEAALSPTGLRQRQRALALYRQNAATMLQMFHKLGLTCAARRPGCLAPYLWVRCPDGPDAQNSWAWFHRLLEGCGVLCAPGAGFGQMGEGWLRFTAFSRPEDTAEALRRMEHFLR